MLRHWRNDWNRTLKKGGGDLSTVGSEPAVVWMLCERWVGHFKESASPERDSFSPLDLPVHNAFAVMNSASLYIV
jgi:hypothetical protein